MGQGPPTFPLLSGITDASAEWVKPVFPRWTPPGASAATSSAEVTPAQDRLQRFSPNKRRRHPPRRGLRLPHQTLLLCSPPNSARQAHLGRTATTFGPVCRARPTSPRGTRQSQPADPVQDPGEQLPRHGDFRQLKQHVLRMTDHLGPDLDQFLPQHRERPALDRLRQHQLPKTASSGVRKSRKVQLPKQATGFGLLKFLQRNEL